MGFSRGGLALPKKSGILRKISEGSVWVFPEVHFRELLGQTGKLKVRGVL
jgi:hypothetical protein